MKVNIVEIKRGDLVLINNNTYDHLPSETISRILRKALVANKNTDIIWMYGDFDVTVVRKVD